MPRQIFQDRRINPGASISQVAGRAVEVTIRGERSFTFSFNCIDKDATAKICAFFLGLALVEVDEDEECGTCIYCEIPQ